MYCVFHTETVPFIGKSQSFSINWLFSAIIVTRAWNKQFHFKGIDKLCNNDVDSNTQDSKRTVDIETIFSIKRSN